MNHLIWNVAPEILRFGPFTLRWYGLLFALGLMLGYFILVRIYRREHRSEENLSSLFLYVLLGTAVGARLGHVLVYQPDYYLARPWEILMIWQGGLASHGGFAGVLVALSFYVRKYSDLSFLELGDRIAIAALPTASLIRVGNLFNSEILGAPSQVPWAIVFTRVDSLPRHPAMLYESVVYALLFAIIYVVYWKTDIIKTPGLMIGVSFVTSFSARFFIEISKEDQVPFEQGMLLNLGQLLSLPFVGVGLVLVCRGWFRRFQS